MKIDFSGLSVKSAKEKLQEIYGAKDFLRGNQEEAPDMFGYYQKQIDDLTQEENELSSWLGENEGRNDDYSDADYIDSVSAEEAEHFNDDLYEGKRKSSKPYMSQEDDTDDDWGIPIYDSEGNQINPNKITQNEMPEKKLIPDSAPLTGRIDTDAESGAGTYYAPDDSGGSIDEFPVIDNGTEPKELDSKTTWELIKDWVNADDGYNNGSIKTDPVTKMTYYVSPSGMQIPITEFGVDESTIQSAQGNNPITSIINMANNTESDAPLTGRIDNDPDGDGTGMYYAPDGTAMSMDNLGTDADKTPSDSSNQKSNGNSLENSTPDSSNNTYVNNPSAKLISVTDSSQSTGDELSLDTPYTEENKAKYNAIYDAYQKEIQALEAQKLQLALGSDGANISTPDIDKRLAELYNQNGRIDVWRNAESAKTAGAVNPGADTKPVEDSEIKQKKVGAIANGITNESTNKLIDFAKSMKDKTFSDMRAAGMTGGTESGGWCTTFISYAAEKAGIPKENIKLLDPSTDTTQKNYSKAGRYASTDDIIKGKYEPQPGDFVVFYSGGDNSHIGIVVSYDSATGTVKTIEGNTTLNKNKKILGVELKDRKFFKIKKETGEKIHDNIDDTFYVQGFCKNSKN